MAGTATRDGERDRRRRTRKAAREPASVSTPNSAKRPTASPVTAALGRRRLIVLIAIALYVFGLVMVASASSGELMLQDLDQWSLLKRQAIFGIVGLSAMWVAMRVPLELVRRLARPLVWLCVGLSLAVMVPGVGHSAYGASRWINLGFFQLQPSEPLKLAVCAMLAAHLATHEPPRHWFNDFVKSPGGAALLIAAMLVGLQSDLGSGLVIGSVTIVLYVIIGTPWKLLWRTIGPGIALVVLSIMTEEYRRDRFLAFIDPWKNPYGDGYQLIQAQLAIGSGGTFGVGLGHSVQKIAFLPEAHTDMIFAVIVEELGIVGVLFVLSSFAVLAGIGVRIALRARSRFSALLAAGLTAMIVGQACVNIAGVTGLMPLTGIPLPLVSYGGSSIIVTLVALGLLANIATERRPANDLRVRERNAAAAASSAAATEDDADDDSDIDWG